MAKTTGLQASLLWPGIQNPTVQGLPGNWTNPNPFSSTLPQQGLANPTGPPPQTQASAPTQGTQNLQDILNMPVPETPSDPSVPGAYSTQTWSSQQMAPRQTDATETQSKWVDPALVARQQDISDANAHLEHQKGIVKADTEWAQGQTLDDAADESRKQLAKSNVAQADIQAQARAHLDEMNTQIDKLSNIATVDPTHFFTDGTTGQQIYGAVRTMIAAIAGGSIAGAPGGMIAGMSTLNKAVQEDVAQQQDLIKHQIEQGKTYIDAKGNLVAKLLEQGRSMAEATHFAVQTGLAVAAKQAEALGLIDNSPATKMAADQTANTIKAQQIANELNYSEKLTKQTDTTTEATGPDITQSVSTPSAAMTNVDLLNKRLEIQGKTQANINAGQEFKNKEQEYRQKENALQVPGLNITANDAEDKKNLTLLQTAGGKALDALHVLMEQSDLVNGPKGEFSQVWDANRLNKMELARETLAKEWPNLVNNNLNNQPPGGVAQDFDKLVPPAAELARSDTFTRNNNTIKNKLINLQDTVMGYLDRGVVSRLGDNPEKAQSAHDYFLRQSGIDPATKWIAYTEPKMIQKDTSAPATSAGTSLNALYSGPKLSPGR